jgi:hypothetical protein
MKVTRKNPRNVSPPIGLYTHLSIVPRGADLLVLSGSVGTDAEVAIRCRSDRLFNIVTDAYGQRGGALFLSLIMKEIRRTTGT